MSSKVHCTPEDKGGEILIGASYICGDDADLEEEGHVRGAVQKVKHEGPINSFINVIHELIFINLVTQPLTDDLYH